MSSWTPTAYAAVTVAAIACAALQPSHASAIEQSAKCLVSKAWSGGAPGPEATDSGRGTSTAARAP